MSRIALFGYDGDPLRLAAEAGLRRLGHEIEFQIPSCWNEGQAIRPERLGGVVVCGLRSVCGDAARFYEARGVPVLAIDYPLLRRDGAHWRISAPRTDALPETGDPRRLADLNIEIAGPRRRVKAQSVLILGQRSGDPTHGLSGSEFRDWARGAIEKTRALCDSRIIWRPHPSDRYELAEADEFSDPAAESLEDAFDRSWLVVTYSSKGGLDAMLAGLPVISEGAAIYSDLSGAFSDFKNVSTPDPEELRSLLSRIAASQWSAERIATGEPFLECFGDALLDISPRAEAPAPVEPEPEPPSFADFGGIGEATAAVLSGAGITPERLLERSVTAEEIAALNLRAIQEAAVRKAAGIASRE